MEVVAYINNFVSFDIINIGNHITAVTTVIGNSNSCAGGGGGLFWLKRK